VPETIPGVNLTGPLGGNSRYTLYPATAETLGVHEIVAECGLPDSFWAAELRCFPHPARSNNETKEYRQKPQKPADEWNDFLIRKVERSPARVIHSKP